MFKITPPIIAHRGARFFAPENTLAAFLKVKELGLNWLELDVQLAACGEVVVFHDLTLERTTNGKGCLSDYPYSYLKTLDAGSWFSSLFAGERIPTLKQVIHLLNRLQLSANIEIKLFDQFAYEKEIVQRVFEVLAEVPITQSILISSFSNTVLQNVRKKSLEVPLGFLMDDWLTDWQDICDVLKANAVDVNHAILNQTRVQEIKATNRLLLSYTVNDAEKANRLLALGVDAVFSDCPEGFLEEIKSL